MNPLDPMRINHSGAPSRRYAFAMEYDTESYRSRFRQSEGRWWEQHEDLRWPLELTQEEFAARYHIPLGTLRDWEQGRAEPDQPTRAYLTLIARDPDHVNRTLNTKSA
jgi:DNA-binding transcriptional regulator YiaG